MVKKFSVNLTVYRSFLVCGEKLKVDLFIGKIVKKMCKLEKYYAAFAQQKSRKNTTRAWLRKM